MENQTNEVLAIVAASQYKTNHVLHLLLSLLTGGLWIFVWIVVANQNGSKRNCLLRQAEGKSKTTMFDKFIYAVLAAPVVLILAIFINGTV